VIKDKKHAVSQADLNLKSLEHTIQVLSKEKTTATNTVANLEKMHDWIAEESEYVRIKDCNR
jgi:structural maintenance of chromosome 2